MFRKECLICDQSNLIEIIDLGMHPLADTFIENEKLHLSEKVYPLVTQLCEDCGNIQLKCTTTPEERYQDNSYSYTSSNSAFSRNYWFQYANNVSKFFPNKKILKILEIGSNDGFLLNELKKLGHQTIGIDASLPIAEIARVRGIITEVGIFEENFSKEIVKKYGQFDLIIANNVFNHSDNPKSFFEGIKNLLLNDGLFIFESPYWLNSIKSGKFDQIYHEHVTYSATKPIKKLVSFCELHIYDISLSEYHGGSLRFIVAKKENKKTLDKVKAIINEENSLELYSGAFYKKFMKSLNIKKNIFMEKIYKKLIVSEPFICVGAAAKGNTFLNFYGLNNKIINYVTDSSENKIGKFTPLTRIQIVSDEIIKEFKKPNIIFTAWNVSENLKKIIQKINPDYVELNPYEN
jgi:2-polyprenyl-3-methyl-5-hydroxy-6-metoxy-1,4-benzoquinol methylase